MKTLHITEENNRYKVVVNGKEIVHINNLKELESAIKGLTVGVDDCD